MPVKASSTKVYFAANKITEMHDGQIFGDALSWAAVKMQDRFSALNDQTVTINLTGAPFQFKSPKFSVW